MSKGKGGPSNSGDGRRTRPRRSPRPAATGRTPQKAADQGVVATSAAPVADHPPPSPEEEKLGVAATIRRRVTQAAANRRIWLAAAILAMVLAGLLHWVWLLVLEIAAVMAGVVAIEYTKGPSRPEPEPKVADLPSDLSPEMAKVLVELGVRTLEADNALLHTQMERLLGFLQVDGVVLAAIVAGAIVLSGAHALTAGVGTLLLMVSVFFISASMLMCIFGMVSGGYGAIPSPGTLDHEGKWQVDKDLEQNREGITYVAIIQSLRNASLQNASLLARRRTTVILAPICLLIGLISGYGAGLAAGLASASAPTVSASPLPSRPPTCHFQYRTRGAADCPSGPRNP